MYFARTLAQQQTTSSTRASGSNLKSSSSPTTATSVISTSTVGNRITYTDLPSCASQCVSSAVQTIPCTPFVAACFCALPTGRISYELPQECVLTSCGSDDRTAESKWRKGVCAGFTSTSSIIISTGLPPDEQGWSTTASAASAGPTEKCGNGWKGCPKAFNGGCCPRYVISGSSPKRNMRY